jgi:DNA invertase Pin-like site-specific DNA recombinase
LTSAVDKPAAERRAALYARVSTGAQDAEPQLAELKTYAQLRGWTIAAEYVDVASGGEPSRPNLSRLMQDAFQRKFDIVLVWKFDRFARSVSHMLRSLEKFHELGIDFVSYTEHIDTSSASGKLVFVVLAAVAELERSLISERVKLGQAAARARGKLCSREPKRVDEEKMKADYAVLGSLLKTSKLHHCSTWLVRRIVNDRRDLDPLSVKYLNNSNGKSVNH